MPRLTPFSVSAAALSLLAGCASSGAPTPGGTGTSVATTRVETPRGTIGIESVNDRSAPATAIAAPPDRVWDGLVAAYRTLGIPVTVADTAAMVLGTRGSSVRRTLGGARLSAWLDCGTSGLGLRNADSYTVRLAVLSSVIPTEDGQTRIRTQVAGDAAAEGSSEARVRCATNGRLERRIAALVAERVR